jgi:glycosyltransferase involved in cell wall biosynthesis
LGRPPRIGLYSPYFGYTAGGGEKYLALTAVALRDAMAGSKVELLSPVPVDAERYRRLLGVDLTGLTLVATNRVTPVHRALNRVTPLRPLRNLVLGRRASRFTARYDLFLPMVYRIPVRSAAPRTAVLVQFPDRAGRGAEGADVVVCQSDYVRGWVRRWWGREAAVVHPPVDVPAEEPDWSVKRRSILAVGRFIRTGHSKRQDVLVECFRELCDGGLEGWELHLAGTVHREGPHAGYFDEVAGRASGYPVILHPDAPLSELSRLYAEASIFWHGAGFGVDPDAEPENLEHFGIATAEAMGRGAVPVVFAAGGQPEVVGDGEAGYLWTTREELGERTLALAADAALRERLGRAARTAAGRFSRERFRTAILDVLQPVLDGLG